MEGDDMTKKFQQNMDKIKERLKTNLNEGIFKAALALQAEAQKRSPVDTGALRASAFTRKEGTPERIEYVVGFTQHYGIYVHEMVGSTFKVGEPKFLEGPAREMSKELGIIILTEVKK